MKDEIDQLEKLGTYQLEDLPMGRQAVGNKWVYNTKINPDGTIWHKVQLVAQGFSQWPSLDCFDTYSPVMRMESLRVLLAITANLDWEAEQMDVVGTYLNGELEETLYMGQPIGFTDGTAKVAWLNKSLYGLKQSGQVWNTKLNDTFQRLGFKCLKAD